VLSTISNNQAKHDKRDKHMPELHIRNVDQSLIREVNLAAAKLDVTQRDFVIRSLRLVAGKPEMLGKGKEKVIGIEKEVVDMRAVTDVEVIPVEEKPTVIVGAKCEICGAAVVLLKRPNAPDKWQCIGRIKHTMTPRKIAEPEADPEF
jgi:hypothetical protein